MITLRLLGGAALDGPDGPVTGRAALRQRLALLALLASSTPARSVATGWLAWLWPESDTADARHLLRESLYILRSALGDDAVLAAGEDLRLNPERLSSDLWEFESAMAGEELERAVGAYGGAFLAGFHHSGAEEFAHWADGERTRLARRYRDALERLADRAMAGGSPRQAIEWWSRLAAEDPYSSRVALRYMEALDASGDRAAALRHAAAHTALLRADLDAAPEQGVVAYAERLRIESRPAAAPAAAATAAPADEAYHSEAAVVVHPPQATVAHRPRSRRWLPAAALLLIVVVGVGVAGGMLSRPHAPAPVLSSHRIAAAVFENRTGRPDLADLGPLAADWIVRGVLETPLVDIPELEAVYAGGGREGDPLTSARQDSAGLMVRGSYWLSGDSVLFQAGLVDVASGRVLRAFDPVGAPFTRLTSALEALRDRITGGLAPLVNPVSVDPDLTPPPSLAAYREFMAGLKEEDSAVATRHYGRAAELDSTFTAPLIQLALRALRADQCATSDSIAAVLDAGRERLRPWDRITVAMIRARCRGDMAEDLELTGQRYRAYPNSLLARGTYGSALLNRDQPRAALVILEGLTPLPQWEPWYWSVVAECRHALGDYRAELAITGAWRDSAVVEWRLIRGRALAALGREQEVMALYRSTTDVAVDAVLEQQLAIASELAAHGYLETAKVMAESLMARLRVGRSTASSRPPSIARANRLLGRSEAEREALERVAVGTAETVELLETRARISVLRADTAEAARVDSALAEQSSRPLRAPFVRARLLLARAHLAAGFGRREDAVARLREVRASGHIAGGGALAFHRDLLLLPLRGYPAFDALLRPAD